MSVDSARVDSDRLLCSRLPTPVHFDRASGPLLSPPLSRASSPLPASLLTIAPTRQVGKKTSAFFSSPFDTSTPEPPPPPSRTRTPSPERAQTANSSFFLAKGSATPTPPPSVHSSVDDGPAPPHPPLARFFPSRAPVDRDPDSSDDPPGLSPPPLQTSFQRDFVTIDDVHSLADSPTELVTPDSPTPKSEVPQVIPPPHPQPLHRETIAADAVVGTDVPLQLIRELGQGAFSCVWLARDVDHKLEQPVAGARPRCESMARRKGDRAVHGLRPPVSGSALGRSQSVYFAARDGEGATADDAAPRDRGSLVAVKMIDRALCDANDRTRISFVREVEVLRHIAHPSIVAYLHSFTTPTHHCLVLEALQGGELFDLLDTGDNHARMPEPLLRRIFGELCQAVGWMHGVGLVHRDLKLENILLTANPFLASPITLAALPAPLVKLTDFGLARFIDPAAPLLATRCGSEAYAAPEIVTGTPYDGRQTDAWACGVVLYALATRALPFDRGSGGGDTRRAYLMRIAQGEYAWPDADAGPGACLATGGLRRVVARLLVREPAKRARVVELWDEAWMRAEGAPPPPLAKAGALVGKDIPSVAREELQL